MLLLGCRSSHRPTFTGTPASARFAARFFCASHETPPASSKEHLSLSRRRMAQLAPGPAPAPVVPTAAPALAPSNYVDTHAHLHGILPPMGYTFDQYPEFRKKFFPSNLDAIVNVRYLFTWFERK
jgi:hypothetical protein